MLSPEHEQILETLLELRPGKPAIVVITSRRLTAGAEILEFLSSRHGFDVADVLEGEDPLSERASSRRRLIVGLPFLPLKERRSFLAALNRGRDRIETLSNQVVLWLYEDDLGEFFSAAPDLAAWVDEVLRWEGPPVERQLYSVNARVSDDHVMSLMRPPGAENGIVTRGSSSPTPYVWIDDSRHCIAPERVEAFLLEIEATGPRPTLRTNSGRTELLEIPPRHHMEIQASLPFSPVASTGHGPRESLAKLDSSLGEGGILFLAAEDPRFPLSLTEEFDAIVSLARAHDWQGDIHWLAANRLGDVVDALSSSSATAVHYSGTSSRDGLGFVDGGPVHPQAFRRALAQGRPHRPLELVFLNTSWAAPSVTSIIEPPAVASAVVAASGSLSDSIAVSFARTFYEELFKGRSIRHAFEWARASIVANETSELRDIAPSEMSERMASPFELWTSGS